ncbi:hypothetical protein BKA56DRAFT_605363 [Ilyonectria sp. MPI-CAGE-AT-0026]|nr:hypothetical protein BKA56DRAFT_605363 [Ilyonectria sp. MPI-CAGE-AT-0026]
MKLRWRPEGAVRGRTRCGFRVEGGAKTGYWVTAETAENQNKGRAGAQARDCQARE